MFLFLILVSYFSTNLWTTSQSNLFVHAISHGSPSRLETSSSEIQPLHHQTLHRVKNHRENAYVNSRNRTIQFNVAINDRCRSTHDIHNIPWIKKSSTFYNLGYPLIKSLCHHHMGHQAIVSSHITNHSIKNSYSKSSQQLRTFNIGCDSIRQRRWLRSVWNSTKAGPSTSTILVDPPCVDDGGASSGVFTINAIYAILYQRGYNTRVRNWSPGLNNSFPHDVVQSATADSLQWSQFINSKGPQTNAINPFANVTDFVSFQVEVGTLYYMKPQPDINNLPFSRDFRWAIGYHHESTFFQYQSSKHHCVGANFMIGEGLHCSSSSIIVVPMFPFHHEASATPVAPDARLALKENIVLIDSDATMEYNRAELENALKAMGIKDAQVLEHKGRKRHEVPALYKRVKVTLDCRNPGVEFINYEAILYDCLTLSCNSRASRNTFDFPIPSKYLLEPSNFTSVVSTLYTLLTEYSSHLDDFKYFQRLSRNSQSYAGNHLDLLFFSRDVLFRTFCSTSIECKSVLPWALSIWTLYPLARIEVFTRMDVHRFVDDNNMILDVHARQFNDRYWRVIKWEGDSFTYTTPVTINPTVPCAYIVFMSPYFLLFGRDFVNDHIKTLDEQKDFYRPIQYFCEGKNKVDKLSLLIAFMKNEIPWRDEGMYTVSVKGNKRKTLSVKNYLVIRGHRYSIDEEILANLQSTAFKSRLFNNDDEVNQDARIPQLASGKSDLSKWDLLKMINVNINTNTNTNAKSRGSNNVSTMVNHELSLDTIASKAGNVGAIPLAIDALFLPHPQSGVAAELWLTSNTPRLNLRQFCLQASYREMIEMVVHLDPIIQNSFFKKARGFFPEHVERILNKLNAIHYPEVISLLDARHQNWGTKGNCSGSIIV